VICSARFIFRTLSEADCDSAIEHFERAIQLDQNFALAHDGLGACYVNRVFKVLAARKITNARKQRYESARDRSEASSKRGMLMVFVYLWRGQKQKARDGSRTYATRSAKRARWCISSSAAASFGWRVRPGVYAAMIV
jgi:hypothetical protein